MDKRIYIIGAGFAGQTIADDIKRKKIFGKVNAFIDDNKDLIGTTIDGIPVLGPISGVTSILSNSDLDEAIIASPSAPTERIREIYETLTKNGLPVSLPGADVRRFRPGGNSAGGNPVHAGNL